MKKGIVKVILSLLLTVALLTPSVFATTYRDPNTPLYILGASFEVERPEVGKLPPMTAVEDEMYTQELSWARSDGEWDETMPFEGGYEYTLTIHATTSGKDYFHDWLNKEGNTVLMFIDPESKSMSEYSPTSIVFENDHSIYVTFTFMLEEAPKTPFVDIEAGSTFEDAVKWAYETGVTMGTSDTTFSPDDPCTRAQAITFLWRAMGRPEPVSKTNPFKDVKESDYFYKSVLWAIENGITNGTSATAFSPDETCTGAHVITFVHRAKGCIPAEKESTLAQNFPDTWFTEALAWADTTGLLYGVIDNFDPLDKSPRAHIVTYLYRIAVEK